MSLRFEMLQTARLAPKLLGESSELIEQFVLRQIHQNGGFKDRAGNADLYYTVFGLESLLVLQSDFSYDSCVPYLRHFKTGELLDFVHLACLARAWADIPDHEPGLKTQQGILKQLEKFRTPDGGYNPTPGAQCGTAYACFLALGAYQDLQVRLPNSQRILTCLEALRTRDGAYANEANMPTGLTSPTAAALTVLHQLGEPPDSSAGDWLLQRCFSQGGFCAAPQIPIPDLLSTATALHALAAMQISIDRIKEPCLDFIDSLWVNTGSFYGNWMDDLLDCEYTYYGLLALGHLS